ncbi:MAG: SusC/RagA family TonB-linked outer membrane protein [Bacteroidales bacterium]|nr:SusC/RagA family TonB-linked outer membrane protein [Bacteroidales bacterium]
MRLLLLFGLFIFLFSVPVRLEAQSTKITLNLVNVPLNDVLNEIEKKSDYTFLVNEEVVDVTRKVDAVYVNTSIKDILDQLFKGDKVKYVTSDHQIIITPNKGNGGDFQSKKVTGRVIDAKTGETLVGVAIQVKGTTSGTTTSIDGTYSIEFQSEKAILVYSYLGYEPKEITVSEATVLNVVLNPIATQLESIVVTALGIKREEKALGYAVQKVDGKGLQTVRAVDVGTSLTGKVAGLSVLNSTEFGAAPELYIRGEKPLLVIDGVPYGNMTLRDIPADDIESLSILKGATASALYGYRGASGAIMVTTKKGSGINGISITLNSSTMFAAGYLAIPESQSTYGRVVNTATNSAVTNGDGAWGPPLEGQEVIQWDPISRSMKPMPWLPVGKDNFQNFLEPGYVLNNNLNIVQQGEYGSFRASASWVKNKGQYPNSMFDKYSYSIGGDMKVKRLTLSSSIGYNKQSSPNIGFSGYTGYDPMYSMLIWSSPDWNVLDYKNYWVVPDETQNTSYTDTNNNPFFDRNERTHSLNKDIFNGSLSLNYDLTSWLKATIRSGFDTYSNRQVIKISKGSLVSAGSATVIENGDQVWGESKLGSYNLGLGRGYSFNNDFLLSGNKTFNKFTIDGFVGGTIFYRQDEGTDSRTQGGLSIPGFYSLKASVLPAYVVSSLSRQQVNSMYGRLALSWNSLVYAEGTLRNDWSSTLSEATRSYLYPSISGSFIASELLPEMGWLSLWKLRGSWTSSKTPAGIYDINQVFNITNNAWTNLTSASLPATIYSSDVFPESSSTWEVGTAVNLYKNRVSFDISYYNKRMFDFLQEADITPATGYYNSYVNIDEEITRKGVEVTLNGTPVKNSDWKWDISVNWSKYARFYSKLDSTYSPDKPWIKVGERADPYVLYDFQYDPDGNIIHKNGVPLYSAYASKFGNYDPDWIWGVNTTLRYKSLNFFISVDGRVGGIAQTTTEMYMWRSGSHPNSVTEERYLDATVDGSKNYTGDGVMVVSGSATYDTYGNITSDDRVYAPNDVAVTYESYINTIHSGTAWGGSPSPLEAYSTTFFKIREMSLTYDLPREICSKFNSQGVSVSAVGQNMFLWSKQFKYSDPDGGYENFSDPSIRYVGFNLKFNF